MRLFAKAAFAFWLTLLSCLAVCHLNHPRLWIQDLLCSVSLYWIPLVVLGFVAVLARCIRARACSIGFLYALIVQGILIARVGTIAKPYIAYSSEAGQGIDIPVLFAHVDFTAEGLPKLATETARRAPSLVVLVGEHEQLAVAREALQGFPFVLESTPEGLLVLSRFEPQDGSQKGLGVGALPGAFLKLRVPQVGTMLFGALSLIPAASQDDFFLSKVTSRRLATLMRYQSEPRVVVGDFNASPFAPLVNMYPRQLGFRSVMYGQGLVRTFDLEEPMVRLTLDNAFVSKDIRVSAFETLEGISRRRSALSFVLRVPVSQ